MNLAHGHLPKPVVGCGVFLILLASSTSRDKVHRFGKSRFGGQNSGSDVWNPECEWNCGTGNHARTELASPWAGSSSVLCGSASFQAARTGIFNICPGKGEIGCLELLGAVPDPSFVNAVQNKAGLWPGCATSYRGHCSCGTG